MYIKKFCYNKHQKSALSRNSRSRNSYYRYIRLKVWNWSFFWDLRSFHVESSSITVKFFSKFQLMNIFLRFLFCSKSQNTFLQAFDCSFDVTSNLSTSASNSLWSQRYYKYRSTNILIVLLFLSDITWNICYYKLNHAFCLNTGNLITGINKQSR